MLRIILRLLVGVPIVLVLVVFALSNTQSVRLAFWPTDLGLDMPLSIAILLAMAISFLVGALCAWMLAFGQRRRTRRAEQLLRRRDAEIGQLRSSLPPAITP